MTTKAKKLLDKIVKNDKLTVTDKEHSQALHSLMGFALQVNTEEQIKRKIQVKKIAKQQGEEGLDTFLTEKLGLDF